MTRPGSLIPSEGVSERIVASIYKPDGKVLTIKVNDTLFADPSYATDQLLQSVPYTNVTMHRLGSRERDRPERA